MRTLLKQMAMATGFALLGVGGLSAVESQTTAIQAAPPSIEMQAADARTPEGARRDCPICDSHCCSGADAQ